MPHGDMELVERAVAGDRVAFRELVERHKNSVYRLALRVTRNEADAQDVLQDTFLTVHRKLGTFQGASAFSSWLYRVTVNAALMRLRQSRRADEISLESVLPAFSKTGGFAANIVDWSDRADVRVERKQLAKIIENAANDLPEKYRLVFLLRDVEEQSTEEVAEVLDLTVAAVKTRLHRARLFLRKAIAEALEAVGETPPGVPAPP